MVWSHQGRKGWAHSSQAHGTSTIPPGLISPLMQCSSQNGIQTVWRLSHGFPWLDNLIIRKFYPVVSGIPHCRLYSDVWVCSRSSTQLSEFKCSLDVAYLHFKTEIAVQFKWLFPLIPWNLLILRTQVSYKTQRNKGESYFEYSIRRYFSDEINDFAFLLKACLKSFFCCCL